MTSDLEPTSIEEELQQGEYRHVEVQVVVWVALRGVQELAANQTHQEEAVHGQSHHLEKWGGATGSRDRWRAFVCFTLLCFVFNKGVQNE